MKRILFAICIVILTVSTSAYAKGKPGGGETCVDVPISWEFLGDGSGSEALLSDGLGPYTDGVNGVANSVIHSVGTCAGSFGTTKDATMNVGNRRFRVKLGSNIPG